MSNLTEWLKERRRIHDEATEGLYFQHWGGQNQNGDYTESILIDEQSGDGLAYGLPDSDGEAIVDSHNTLPALLTAVEKVLELHGPVASDVEGDRPHCHLCGYWPCDTYRAIEGAINE